MPTATRSPGGTAITVASDIGGEGDTAAAAAIAIGCSNSIADGVDGSTIGCICAICSTELAVRACGNSNSSSADGSSSGKRISRSMLGRDTTLRSSSSSMPKSRSMSISISSASAIPKSKRPRSTLNGAGVSILRLRIVIVSSGAMSLLRSSTSRSMSSISMVITSISISPMSKSNSKSASTSTSTCTGRCCSVISLLSACRCCGGKSILVLSRVFLAYLTSLSYDWLACLLCSTTWKW
mmetsp:Transcript_19769/g.31470  ORF Transcript_19769/g.31470 Transcript_19769/m.31470 type:complete len:239 (-) Transcript_19769:279-995(-)